MSLGNQSELQLAPSQFNCMYQPQQTQEWITVDKLYKHLFHLTLFPVLSINPKSDTAESCSRSLISVTSVFKSKQ